ncbi:Putative ATP-dependent helicase IRC3 [Cladobotryum mycophilum]|uniref:ATP-dependent helicase IRC3 n=1 Tax=Cladobotryum mycophilum TaxID=491253 RepID=A0ABR0T1Z3_9HYPO
MIYSVVRRLVRPHAGTGVPVAWFGPLRRTYATAAVAAPDSKPKLRSYQEECIKSVLWSLKHGHKRLGISLATGSGKTVIFTQLINKVLSRTGVLTRLSSWRIAIEMGSLHASGIADITIASVQSITSKGRLDKFDPAKFKLVLVDEAHHIVAPGYLKTLKHFGLDEKRNKSPALIGVSATFSRFDGLKLGAAIDEIVYHKDYVDMISDKWLSDVVFTTVASSANLSKVKAGAFGDFATGELSKAVNTDIINDITVRSWMAKAGDRKSTLVFCVDLAHVGGLTRKFREYGFDARYVTGDTPKTERSATLDAFKQGNFPVLVNCGVYTEGTDIPNIDCIVLGRPTRSRNLLVQMIGRGMRLHPGKKDCHIIDMVSSLETGIVTTPTLFGLNPNELLEKASVKKMRKLKEEKEASVTNQQDRNSQEQGLTLSPSAAVTFTDYSSVLDLIADTSGEKHIRAISNYAWVQNRAHNRRRPLLPRPIYRAVEIRALPAGLAKSPFAAPREILTAATFNDAVNGADSYAASAFPHTFIHRFQQWRKLPPTQGQLDFINKLRGKGKPFKPSELTKGKAADMITKLKHGARGQFARIEAQQKKREKLVTVADAKLDRERVRVGPLSA